MKLIIGLGNTGLNYQMTRHNIGFMVLDSLSDGSWSKKSNLFSLIQKIQIDHQSVLLSKPQTQMNLSGQAVQCLMKYYDIPIENLLIVQDDLDLEFLSMKFQKSKGNGGHNGIKNIHDLLGTNKYYRLKLGIGHPQVHPLNENKFSKKSQVHSHVLSPFKDEEIKKLTTFLQKACDGVIHFISKGGEDASQYYNQKNSLPSVNNTKE